jgi:hypothetical protein
MDDRVVLKYTATKRDDAELLLVYRVTNGSDRPIFVLSPLTRMTEEGPGPAPGRVYAFLDLEGVLQVTKRLWPVPEGVSVYLPEVPCATEVPPGKHFEERLTLKLPVWVDYPYRFIGEEEPEEPPEEITAEPTGLAFSIGYIAEGDSPIPMEPAAGGTRGVFEVGYGDVAQSQVLLQGETLGLQVLVKDVDRE